MFSSSMDSARDTSGVAGTVLIPMRFVWPYGGRSVYLSGSFTRWSELLQMSPVEGCPTVFQVIHSLAPGYHQYKFYVDGEWRHDEHQPYISGEIGIVNTVLLATDPNFVPVLNPDIASGSNMDVDNEGFRRVVRLTDGTLSEVLPRISDVDVQTSRQRISAFLSMRTAYELLPESGKYFLGVLSMYFRHCSSSLPILQLPICAIPVGTWLPKIGESNRRPLAMLRPSASVTSALNLLVQAQVSSIPIVDDNDSLLDIYCRSDITALAKDRAYTHINLDEMTVQQALQLGQDSYNPYELRSQRCQMCLRSDSLHKVMERLANPGVRRLIIVEAGSKRVEGVVSLSDIFKFFLG
ncbi:hypothetical protein Ahy_B01g055714 isoform D [Arachis hypogaea]|uniref:CBS domain-containing protein n=1 Tax=Arachis hypogaea TaxID=3818 RepID=A0A445AX23_ARAHY|nr:hypothetical protein Ahy_B01g055714 isoform D [Arachis hypogaea]